MFHKILVATGGSPWSDKAVEYAVEMASDYVLELMILHVVSETPPYFIAEAGASLETLLSNSEETGRSLLTEAAATAAEAGVTCTTELVWGRVPDTVCRVAQENDCDLIVVGSRALTGFKRLMLGGISNAIASKARCPVLIVKWYET
jgi:nucleotide-binding universal stress UspA family protein